MFYIEHFMRKKFINVIGRIKKNTSFFNLQKYFEKKKRFFFIFLRWRFFWLFFSIRKFRILFFPIYNLNQKKKIYFFERGTGVDLFKNSQLLNATLFLQRKRISFFKNKNILFFLLTYFFLKDSNFLKSNFYLKFLLVKKKFLSPSLFIEHCRLLIPAFKDLKKIFRFSGRFLYIILTQKNDRRYFMWFIKTYSLHAMRNYSFFYKSLRYSLFRRFRIYNKKNPQFLRLFVFHFFLIQTILFSFKNFPFRFFFYFLGSKSYSQLFFKNLNFAFSYLFDSKIFKKLYYFLVPLNDEVAFDKNLREVDLLKPLFLFQNSSLLNKELCNYYINFRLMLFEYMGDKSFLGMPSLLNKLLITSKTLFETEYSSNMDYLNVLDSFNLGFRKKIFSSDFSVINIFFFFKFFFRYLNSFLYGKIFLSFNLSSFLVFHQKWLTADYLLRLFSISDNNLIFNIQENWFDYNMYLDHFFFQYQQINRFFSYSFVFFFKKTFFFLRLL
jgi:hypothetical protein